MLYSSGYFSIENFYGFYTATSFLAIKEYYINPADHQENFYDWLVHAVLQEQYNIKTKHVPRVDTDVGKCLLDKYFWHLALELNTAFKNFNFSPMQGYMYKVHVLGPEIIISKGVIHA